jgi:hypothetical protein
LTPLTQVGDLFRNFGIAGVVAGLLIWGVVLGAFTVMFRTIRSPRNEMVYIVGLATSVLFVETILPELLSGAARTLAVATLVAWVVLPGRGSSAGYGRILAWLPGRWRRVEDAVPSP